MSKTCMTNNDDVDIGNGVLLEKAEMFCYLEICWIAVRGVSVTCAWKKFSKYLSILTGKGFLLKLKGKICTNCVRSCLIYD